MARLAAEGYGAYAARFSSGVSAPVAASTANACAKPRPGEAPGCEATLDTALLGGGASAATALRAIPGVLEVGTETTQRVQTVRVVFDPKQIAYGDLLDKWAAIEASTDGAPHIVFYTSSEQQQIATNWKAHAARSAVELRAMTAR